MLNWKAEEMKITNEKYFLGSKTKYYVEDKYTVEEKLEIMNKFSENKIAYFIELNGLYMKAFADGEIKVNNWGSAKENSKKSWIRVHDTEFEFWNGKSKDNMWTNDYFYCSFFPCCSRWYFGYNITNDMINKAFHGLCVYLEEKEKEWFCEHDEYELLKTEYRELGCNSFGNRIGNYSDGSILVFNNEEDYLLRKSRPITIEELKMLIEKQKKLNEYEKELEKESLIIF